MLNAIIRGCLRASPVFRREIQELDCRFSDSKQRFDASLIAGCVRCRFGKIQVLVCRPFSRRGRPFPTSFWIVCPYISHRAGVLESQGGVRELEASIKNIHEWRRYNILHQKIRLELAGKCDFMRKYHRRIFRSVMRSGIGGMKQTEAVSVKCLHLQAASCIAIGHHPGEKWLIERGLCSDCGGEGSCFRSHSL